MLCHRAPLLRLRVTEFFYSSFARDLGSVVALHDPVGFLSFAIVVQTVNELNPESSTPDLGAIVQSITQLEQFNSWLIVDMRLTDNLHQPNHLEMTKYESCFMRNQSMSF